MAQEIADSTLLDTWGSGGNIVEPDISKIIEGWQLGEQPPHEYMNWLQNTFGSKLNHILKNGIAEWNNETEYLAGASVQHSGNVWICETTNINSEPTDLNANWEKVAISKDLTVSVDTLADLRSISYPANTVWASGYHAKNDGAFGSHIFRLKGVKTTETDNGGTVIIATIGGVDYVYELQFSGSVNVKWFGAVGDGITDDGIAIDNANGAGVNDIYVPKGTYLISLNQLIFPYTIEFQHGAKFKLSGVGAIVINKVVAGDYIIFESDNDFISRYEENTKIKIVGTEVKVDWFATKVANTIDIKTIPDQTNNIMKAIRAAMGDFTGTTPYFKCEYASGIVRLGIGRYRVDGTIYLGKAISGVYYRVDGCRFSGHGSASSFLYRTDLTSLSYVFVSFYTGELTTIDNFKINSYDPDEINPFISSSRAGMFLQGDSLHLNNIWVSGMQVPVVDTNSIARNGIGIQFSSCIDTYMHDIFIENCVTGIAFGSSLVTGNNIEVYVTSQQAFGLGVFVADWPDTQTTSSNVYLSGVQARGTALNCFTVLENGTSNSSSLGVSNSYFDGYNSESSQQVGTRFIKMKPNTTLKPSFINCNIHNYTYKTIDIQSGCKFGDLDRQANFVNCKFEGQTSTPAAGVFYATSASMVNINVENCNFSNIAGVLYSGGMADNDSQVTMNNIHLSNYRGQIDASTNRQFAVGAGNIRLSNFTRDLSDAVTINQIAYWGSGRIYVDFSPILTAVTRAISGNATKVMPQITTFL